MGEKTDLRAKVQVLEEALVARDEKIIELELALRRPAAADHGPGVASYLGIGGALAQRPFRRRDPADREPYGSLSGSEIGPYGGDDDDDDDGEPVDLRPIAKMLGIDEKHAASVAELADAIRILRDGNAGMTVDGAIDHPSATKGDSLAQAIEHNRTERAELYDSLVGARNIVNKVGAALGLSTWDIYGAEIIERAQRFSAFHYGMRNRLAEAETRGSTATNQEEMQCHAARADELRTLLTALLAPLPLSKFIADRPAITTSAATLEAALGGQVTTGSHLDKPFTSADLHTVVDAMAAKLEVPAATPRQLELVLLWNNMRQSGAAATEIVGFINLFVLPILRRARGPAPQAAQPKVN